MGSSAAGQHDIMCWPDNTLAFAHTVPANKEHTAAVLRLLLPCRAARLEPCMLSKALQ
jgi:hypothetical protein